MTRQHERQTPRLLPLSEYLELIAMGAFLIPPSARLVQAGLIAAEAVWPEIGLDAWQAQPRDVVACFSAANGHTTLCHVSAGRPNCFLILALESASLQPASYIVLHLGGAYAKPILRCPGLLYPGPTTQTAIAAGLPGPCKSSEAFIQIETGPGTCLQVSPRPQGESRLEHSRVKPENRYQSEALDIVSAVQALRSGSSNGHRT